MRRTAAQSRVIRAVIRQLETWPTRDPAEVWTAGRGGLALVSKITGLVRSTINRGMIRG